MTNSEILRMAMEQSAKDLNCRAEDFCREEPVVVRSCVSKEARNYLELPFLCDFVSYGDNIVASVTDSVEPIVLSYIKAYPAEHCFETPHMHVLNDQLKPLGMRICHMAEYFLPDMECLKPLACDYEVALLQPKDFSGYYFPEWANALCKKRREWDRLAVGAFLNGELVGLAGASEDCDTMWQIGIDVLPEYRRQGIAAALTSQLAWEIVQRGKVPFYCAAWSNVRSVRNAIKSGFRPAWVEMTAKSEEQISQWNHLNEEGIYEKNKKD